MIHCIRLLFDILQIYYYFLIAGILLSWLPFLYQYKIFRAIRKIGDWYMGPFSGVLVLGPIDFTPIVGFIVYTGILELLLYLL